MGIRFLANESDSANVHHGQILANRRHWMSSTPRVRPGFPSFLVRRSNFRLNSGSTDDPLVSNICEFCRVVAVVLWHFCHSHGAIALPADQSDLIRVGLYGNAQTVPNHVDGSKLLTVMSKPHGSHATLNSPMVCRHPRPSVVSRPSLCDVQSGRSGSFGSVTEFSVSECPCKNAAAPICFAAVFVQQP